METKKTGFPVKSYWVSIQSAEIRDVAQYKKKRIWDPPLNTELMFGFSHAPKAKQYNPFDYYYNPVPDYIVIDILGDRINLQNIPLYTLFASLDPDNHEQILKFCYYFGFPRYMIPYPENKNIIYGDYLEVDDFLHEENFVDVDYEQEYWHLAPLNLVANDIIGFKTFLFITHEISKGHTVNLELFPQKELDALLNSQGQTITYYGNKNTHENHCYSVMEPSYINYAISKIINKDNYFLLTNCDSFLKNIFPSLNYENNSYNLSWNFSNLISAMYFMLSLDLSANKVPLQCSNPLCKRFFIPNKTGALYCSDTCQNRAKQQRYRAKKKDIKEGE